MTIILICLHFLNLAGAAETAFRNLRNKYGREKKRVQNSKVSGSGTQDVHQPTSDLFLFMPWLDPYVQPRQTISNLSTNSDNDVVLQESKGNSNGGKHNNIDDDDVDLDDSVSVASGSTNISSVTGNIRYTKKR